MKLVGGRPEIWKQFYDNASKRHYYHNYKTGESIWKEEYKKKNDEKLYEAHREYLAAKVSANQKKEVVVEAEENFSNNKTEENRQIWAEAYEKYEEAKKIQEEATKRFVNPSLPRVNRDEQRAKIAAAASAPFRTKASLEKAFKEYDTNNAGKLKKKELMAMIGTVKGGVTEGDKNLIDHLLPFYGDVKKRKLWWRNPDYFLRLEEVDHPLIGFRKFLEAAEQEIPGLREVGVISLAHRTPEMRAKIAEERRQKAVDHGNELDSLPAEEEAVEKEEADAI